MKRAAKTETEIIDLLVISEKQGDFSDQEIDDLTVISEHLRKLTRLSIFLYERKHDFSHCLNIYLKNPNIQKHLFTWILSTHDSLKA